MKMDHLAFWKLETGSRNWPYKIGNQYAKILFRPEPRRRRERAGISALAVITIIQKLYLGLRIDQ
jgi:hypothetical protein